ncbi:MAG: helix-turn-helix domain-containing protein [Solirubrobacterales bacterium]
MSPNRQRPPHSPARARADLAKRIEARRPEIEEAIRARAYAVSNPTDAEYLQGLRAAISAAVGFGLGVIERGEERSGPLPAAMLTQARHAARNRVDLETVLRRYFAGFTTLGDFLVQEAGKDPATSTATVLHRLQKELAALFDSIVVSISAEYRHEAEHLGRSARQRDAERVNRLLAGELIETSEFDYDFEAWHLGAIATGPEAERLLRDLTGTLDRRLLLVEGGEGTVWAWLGGRRKLEAAELASLHTNEWPVGTSLTLGEAAPGLRGWRATHRQAQAAHTVALRDPQPLTLYADVALLASTLQDEVLVGFLTDAYLTPLFAECDRGAILRQTLSAYLAAGQNVSSAAAAVGASRKTVSNRLQAIEQRIGRPLKSCTAELEMTLRLDRLRDRKPPL